MKLIISKILYYFGDIISRTTMRWGEGFGYTIYNKVMLLSVTLDTDGKLWKKVKSKKKK